ncbi:hypothetical protein [Peribacillus sp. SCS-37]|uniref:hypothetical protein n=1 Tax=Paraperibacillus esterisolvens TaxID=3115296 RepID=UPI003905E943
MNSEKLLKWVKEHDIKLRAIKVFWEVLHNWRTDDSDFDSDYGEMNPRLIHLEFDKISFTHLFENGDYIEVRLRIYYNEDYIGSFRPIYTLDGEHEDEFLTFENKDYIRLLVETTNTAIEIAEKALKEEIPVEVVHKITDLSLSLIEEIKSDRVELKDNLIMMPLKKRD